MTKRSRTRTTRRGKEPVPTIDPAAQAARILEGLARWLAASPGRTVTLEHAPDGWRSTLTEARPSRGETLSDATAQSAAIAYAETSEAPLP